MKKVFLAVALLILAMSLTGCVTIKNSFQTRESIDQISGIEIYYIDIDYSNENNIDDIDESFEPVKIIDHEMYTEIINDLEALEFKDTIPLFMAIDPHFYLYGFIIKIEYTSSVYQLVSNCGTVYTYDASGFIDSFHGEVDQEIWDELIIKYAGEDLFNNYNKDV